MTTDTFPTPGPARATSTAHATSTAPDTTPSTTTPSTTTPSPTPPPSTTTARPASARRHRAVHFTRHYLEMLAAMLVGMVALGPLEGLVWPHLTDRADVGVLVMATNMSIGMAAWMRFRGHSWRPIAEMSAAMYLPFAVLLVPFWAGAVGGQALMLWGHLLMLPALAAAMLVRRSEYAH